MLVPNYSGPRSLVILSDAKNLVLSMSSRSFTSFRMTKR
jgi:hypothetical protein